MAAVVHGHDPVPATEGLEGGEPVEVGARGPTVEQQDRGCADGARELADERRAPTTEAHGATGWQRGRPITVDVLAVALRGGDGRS